jgi:peptide/nickel transport system permease protein
MGSYVIRRLLLLIPSLLFTSLIVFLLMRLIPGDAVHIMVQQHYGNSDAIVRHELGLDKPVLEQYLAWVGGMAHGDFGHSIWSHRAVLNDLTTHGQVTIEIAAVALILILLVGIPGGVLSAVQVDGPADYILRTLATLGLAIPVFWLGTLALVFPSIWFHYNPPTGFHPLLKEPLANLRQVVLPAVLLAIGSLAASLRLMRASMLEVLHQDYVRTARAKGLRERQVVMRHAVRNALIPSLTLIGNQIPYLIGGSVIIETLFSLPGLGAFLFDAIQRRDYPVVQGINVVIAGAILLINQGIDVSYSLINPRIRYR